MTSILTTSTAIISKAGAGASPSASLSTALLSQWSDEAEGYLRAATLKNWSTAYSTLSPSGKYIISDVVSSEAAKKLISYDVSGYLPTEQGLLLDFNDDLVRRGIEILREKDKAQKHISETE